MASSIGWGSRGPLASSSRTARSRTAVCRASAGPALPSPSGPPTPARHDSALESSWWHAAPPQGALGSNPLSAAPGIARARLGGESRSRASAPGHGKLSQRKRGGRDSVRVNASVAAAAGAASDDVSDSWGAITERLIDLSTVGFLFLMLPQIIKNAGNLSAGNPSALSILPWMGYGTGLLGNLLLLTYFAGKGERGAAVVQGVGVVSTAFLLSQVFVAGFMPAAAFWPGLAMISAGLLLNFANFQGWISEDKGAVGPPLLGAWQGFIGLVGVAVLPGVVWNTFSATPSSLPGLVAAASGATFLGLDSIKALPEAVSGVWGAVSAWAATLLFMFMPVAQLRANFVSPSSLEGISLVFVLLAMVSNGLMVPRALYTGDVIWLTGCTWGSLMMGWAQLLSMFRGGYLPAPAFWGLSATIAAYYVGVLLKTAAAQGHAGPLGPIRALFKKQQQQQ